MSSEWRKSSFSGGNTGSCVEVATADAVLVRDTTQQGAGPVLRVSPGAWLKFTRTISK